MRTLKYLYDYGYSKDTTVLCCKMIYLAHRICKHKRKKARWLKAYNRLECKSYSECVKKFEPLYQIDQL